MGKLELPLGDRMTLKNTLLMAFAAITLISNSAGAYIVPGNPPPPAPVPRPAPYPGDDGYQPGYPGPGRDDFGNGYGRQEQKVIYINRRVVDETLELRQLAGIGPNYRGFTVESVVVDIRGSGPRAEVSLLTDGRMEESAYSPQGRLILRPRFGAVLGQDIRTLQLGVRGMAFVDSITINLRENGGGWGPGRPDRPGREQTVPLYVSRRMYGNDRLDLTQYIDMYRYRGMRIVAIDIEATPVFNTALIDVVINGFNQGPSLQVDRYRPMNSVYPQNAVLGQGADSIVFYTRGDLDIRGVTLRLSR